MGILECFIVQVLVKTTQRQRQKQRPQSPMISPMVLKVTRGCVELTSLLLFYTSFTTWSIFDGVQTAYLGILWLIPRLSHPSYFLGPFYFQAS